MKLLGIELCEKNKKLKKKNYNADKIKNFPNLSQTLKILRHTN